MIKLIKNELFKIFHKKSIYVLAGIMFAFVMLNNIVYKVFYDDSGNFSNQALNDSSWEIEYYSQELKNLDVNKESNKEEYVSYKTSYDIAVLHSSYQIGTWQYNLIDNRLYDIIYNINYYTYIEKNDKLLKEYQDKYDYYINSFENNNFKVFIKEELDSTQKEIDALEKEKKTITSTKRLKEIEDSLNILYIKKEMINYRISNDVPYSNSYLNTAIEDYIDTCTYLNNINVDSLSYNEKIEYNNNLSQNATSKYIIDNKIDLNQENTVRNNLRCIFNSYEILIVILIIIISGTIISNEFNKGTIKNLLIRPYKRSTIFISKYISSFIILILSIIYLVSLELIVGGILFGLDSLNIPIVVYNFTTSSLVEYNIFTYLGILILAKMPLLILIMTLSITLSTITLNSPISIAVPILGYTFSGIIGSLAMSFDLKWMKYFPTMNWDLTEYLFGGLPAFQYTSLSHAIIISIIYFAIMFTLSIIVFNKKNIKNI
ncbi:MAG: ABC transporter permease subunit [Bacilli bacterium]